MTKITDAHKIAAAEAARNLTCSGARPLAVTDCLNFGNPYKTENFWQLREAVEGVAEACRVFGTPVTGGNVSLYNESPLGVVDPTPTVAMVGLIDDEKHITTQWFKNEGDIIILVGMEPAQFATAFGFRPDALEDACQIRTKRAGHIKRAVNAAAPNLS